MNTRELEKIGLVIYACEGTRIRRDRRKEGRFIYPIEVTNSNPGIIRLFLKFMRVILKIDKEKLRGQLFVYRDLDKEGLEGFWSERTKIPLAQFNKTIMLNQKNSRYVPNKMGTFKIRYYDKALRIKLEEMINKLYD